ncbi:MAG: hypothetical protein K0Q81_713 [Paenibacillus sp.]|nr:hypothetical protein [Paenibacillus sp.]
MNLKRMRFHKRSVIVTWLVSYISVLLVPIIISGIIYAAAWHVVETEINRTNESLLRQMEQAIDNSLGGLERLSVEIALSKRVAGFINAAQPLTDNDYYELFSIANDLRVYKVANDYLEQIYIYYKNSDVVLSTRERMNSRSLHQYVRQKEDMSYEEWKAFFDKRYIQEYAPVELWEDGKPVKAVLYAKSVILDNPDQPGAVILFVIKDSKLLENIAPANQASIAVLDKQNRLVASTGFEHTPGFLQYERLTDQNGFFYEHAGENQVAVSYTTSSTTGWKYVSMIPAELFDEKMKYMKKLIYISIVLCLAVGGLVTYIFLKRNYNPINLLIRSLSLRSGVSYNEQSNEYMYLEDALQHTFAEKEKSDLRLKQNHSAIRSHFLQGLLKGRLDRSVPVHESLAAHDILLATPYFAVLLMHIDNYGKFEAEEGYGDHHKLKMLHFIIRNVTEEVISMQHQAFTAEIDDTPVCIVNFVKDPSDHELARLAGQVKLFLLDHFHVNLTIAISGVHQDLYSLPQAYQETLEAMEYRLVMGSGEIIRYADLPHTQVTAIDYSGGSYYYPLHTEQQLINFVKTGDFQRSKDLMEEIISINVSNTSISVPLAKCLMFDLISTLLKTMDEIGTESKRKVMEHVDPINRLIACETIKDMKIQISDVLERVCRTIEEDRKLEHNPISQQVIQYVMQHYSNENLNISMIGETFGLTPSYLSKQFKTQTGEALLDFINKIRLEEAKKLLAEQKLPIAEIARRAGYSDINTFNRIFKKFEGITPGKYKGIL